MMRWLTIMAALPTVLCAAPLTTREAPRYLFFNIAPASAWDQNQLETVSRTMFDEVSNTLRAPENPRLRIGVSFVFNTLETPTNILARSLRRLLSSSEEAGMPVLVTLDGQDWWQRRPDLWNWWDTKHLPFWPAFNDWSSPGWSFYRGGPREAGPLESEMKAAGRERWAAAEWWWGGVTAAEWENHFRRTLSFRDCRFICVYYWNLGMFENAALGQEAVRKLVAEWRE
jgi:hypothetical protein